MAIPLRINDVKLIDRWPRHIIIHHTHEWSVVKGHDVDLTNFQVGDVESDIYNFTGKFATKYHFIVERTKGEFYATVSQPLFTEAEWADIPKEYKNAVHIGIIGNYDIDIPMTRMYSVLAFKVIFPLMRMFRISEDNILLHNEVSDIQDLECPGEFFDKEKLITYIRKYRRMKPLLRN